MQSPQRHHRDESVLTHPSDPITGPAGDAPLLHEVSGAGEPIVLLPGGLSGWTSWIPAAQRLSEHRRVIRVQLRSVELAERGVAAGPDYGTHTEREALRATVDHLGLERADLAGWSYGGHVALAFALAYPERVRTLTVIEPPAVWILRESGYPDTSLAETEAFDRSLNDHDVTIDDLKQFLVRAGLGKSGVDVESLPGWPGWVRNRRALAINGTIWEYHESLSRLRRLTIPILAVRGTDTTAELAAIVDELAETAPNVTRLVLPGDHACHLQNLDRFLDALGDHLAAAQHSAAHHV